MSKCTTRLILLAIIFAYGNIFAWKYYDTLFKPKSTISSNVIVQEPIKNKIVVPKYNPQEPPFVPKTIPPSATLNIDNFGMVLKNPIQMAIATSPFQLVIMDTDFISGKEKNRFTAKQISDLRKNKTIMAYLSIGEAEKYRAYWKDEWSGNRPQWMGRESLHWKGVYAIREVMNDQWSNIVKKRLDQIISDGYNGVVFAGLTPYREQVSDKARSQMINFVIELSEYAKSKKPGFTVFVMDSEELLANDTYLKLIDGIVKQSLFYDWKSNGVKGSKNNEEDIKKSLVYLRKAKQEKKNVLVIEYIQGTQWADAKEKIRSEGFIGYSAPRQLTALRIQQ